MRALIYALTIASLLAMAGCGGDPNCSNPKLIGASISPATAVADHNAASPGNHAIFNAIAIYDIPSGCVTTADLKPLSQAQWSVSDSTKVSLTVLATMTDTSAALATCLGATGGPVTITATAPVTQGSTQTVSATAALTCN